MALKDPDQAKLLKADYRAAITRLCVDMNLKLPVAEYVFYPGRKWRFDYSWPAIKTAIEIDGGILRGGRHTTSISGRLRDMEKHNAAASMGWLVLTASTLPAPIFAKKKLLKNGWTKQSSPVPWLSLDDPAFRDMLKAALASRKEIT